MASGVTLFSSREWPWTSDLRSSNRGFDLIFKRSCPLGASKLACRDKECTETQ